LRAYRIDPNSRLWPRVLLCFKNKSEIAQREDIDTDEPHTIQPDARLLPDPTLAYDRSRSFVTDEEKSCLSDEDIKKLNRIRQNQNKGIELVPESLITLAYIEGLLWECCQKIALLDT